MAKEPAEKVRTKKPVSGRKSKPTAATSKMLKDVAATLGEASFVEAVASYECVHCKHPFGSTAGHAGPVLTIVPCPQCGVPFLVPGRIGDFVLVDRLASDRMGNIYRATGLTLTNDVVIKVVSPSATATRS